MFRPSGISDGRCAGALRRRSARQPSWPPPAASLSVGGTTPDIFVARLHDLGTAWHELKRVVPRSASPPTQARLIVMIEGGAVPCLSPVVTDFPEISRKFEGLRLELVSRNFGLVQQKSGTRPNKNTGSCRTLKTRRSVRNRVRQSKVKSSHCLFDLTHCQMPISKHCFLFGETGSWRFGVTFTFN